MMIQRLKGVKAKRATIWYPLDVQNHYHQLPHHHEYMLLFMKFSVFLLLNLIKTSENIAKINPPQNFDKLWGKKKMIVWAISLSSIQKFTMYLKSWYSNHCMSSAFFFYFYFYWWNQRNKIVVEIRSHATQIFSWPDQYVYYAILYKNVTDAIINTAFNFIFGEN